MRASFDYTFHLPAGCQAVICYISCQASRHPSELKAACTQHSVKHSRTTEQESVMASPVHFATFISLNRYQLSAVKSNTIASPPPHTDDAFSFTITSVPQLSPATEISVLNLQLLPPRGKVNRSYSGPDAVWTTTRHTFKSYANCACITTQTAQHGR